MCAFTCSPSDSAHYAKSELYNAYYNGTVGMADHIRR